MPPKLRMIWSTSRIGSGFADPGSAGTLAISARRTSGSASLPGVAATVVWSDIEAQLPLVAEDSLWPEDHQQHQRDAHADPGELRRLGSVHDAVGHQGVGHALD